MRLLGAALLFRQLPQIHLEAIVNTLWTDNSNQSRERGFFVSSHGSKPILYSIPSMGPIFLISFEDPLNTKSVIELAIRPKRHIMQLLKSISFCSVLEFVKDCL